MYGSERRGSLEEVWKLAHERLMQRETERGFPKKITVGFSACRSFHLPLFMCFIFIFVNKANIPKAPKGFSNLLHTRKLNPIQLSCNPHHI